MPALEPPTMTANVQHSSETVEHFTPPEIVEAARDVLGTIDLDPASCALANRIVRAKAIFTKRRNGLTKPWYGNVFLNPPGGVCDAKGRSTRKRVSGGGSAAAAWWGKLATEYSEGRVDSAIFIGFSLELLQRTQGRGYPYMPLDCPFCIPTKRIRFLRAHGRRVVPGNQPTHANVIVYLGHDAGQFVRAFYPLGCVVYDQRVVTPAGTGRF